jgi:hypothetical protein
MSQAYCRSKCRKLQLLLVTQLRCGQLSVMDCPTMCVELSHYTSTPFIRVYIRSTGTPFIRVYICSTGTPFIRVYIRSTGTPFIRVYIRSTGTPFIRVYIRSTGTPFIRVYIRSTGTRFIRVLIRSAGTLFIRVHPHVGVSWHPISSVAQAWSLLERGRRVRSVASTSLHAHSSRSHALITLLVSQPAARVRSAVTFVDLAGRSAVHVL